ncbi:MAG: excinuclease ABC subunit UvrC [Dehalococcoidales bacterium]|nr:excinuclease ABC subunit UvrC [Dehalococcoidales bacterium]
MTDPSIVDQLNTLPFRPGVYLFKDDKSTIIYVGKANKLRNRVRSYFQKPDNLTGKTQQLVARIRDLEFFVTNSEQEALVLEQNLVKRYRPHYNVRLKDDKAFPFLKIDLKEEWPRIFLTRRVLEDGGRYFGPFTSPWSVRETLKVLKKIFRFRTCSKPVFDTASRACLEYHIGQCVGPCAGNTDKEEYAKIIKQVILFLEGKQDAILKQLRSKMETASESLEFEKAAAIRDQIAAIERVIEGQKIAFPVVGEQDVIAFAVEKDIAAVQIFLVRDGRVIGRETFTLQGVSSEEPTQIMSSFVKQFYSSATHIPPLIMLQYPVEDKANIEEWLGSRRGSRVRLHVPARGKQKQLVDMVASNAEQGLQQLKLRQPQTPSDLTAAMEEIKKALNLPRLPERMECYDISNIQGKMPVGSMVVFEIGKPKTADYRRFRIKMVTGADDYAMLAEVLKRRFKRSQAAEGGLQQPVIARPLSPQAQGEAIPVNPINYEIVEGSLQQPVIARPLSPQAQGEVIPGNPVNYEIASFSARPVYPERSRGELAEGPPKDAEGPSTISSPLRGEDQGEGVRDTSEWSKIPDLVLIDGGKGQLNAALAAMKAAGAEAVPAAGLAKEREEIFIPGRSNPIVLPPFSPARQMLQRLRDEAHRFAITYHRNIRKKESFASVLDTIPGIGKKRKRALLRKFGSIHGIREASTADLAAAAGMSSTLAQKVKDNLSL